MGNLKRALTTAIASPDETTLSALVDAADKSLTTKNFATHKDKLIAAIDQAVTVKQYDPALALLATADAVSEDDADVLQRAADCLIKVGEVEAVLPLADRLYGVAKNQAARIQAQHLRVKVWAHYGNWPKAKETQDFLRGLLGELVEGPLIGLEDSCWVMGSLFWFAGYFDDYEGDRALYNLVSEFCQRSIQSCI
jgi:hypothetical protein